MNKMKVSDKTSVQVIPYEGPGRVETGVVQFGDDWPGIFIRGDNALEYSFAIDYFDKDPIQAGQLKLLGALLRSCMNAD